MQKYKKYIIIFFVTIFSLLKLVNLHCYTHKVDHLDGKPCPICELVLLDNNTPLLLNQETVFYLVSIKVQYYTKRTYYSLIILSKNVVSTLFSRPPPLNN